MSKFSSTTPSVDNSLKHINVNDQRSHLVKLTKDQKVYDAKSPSKPLLLSAKTSFTSPTQVSHKGSYYSTAYSKSPTDRFSPGRPVIEPFDGKENSVGDTRPLSTTKKSSKDISTPLAAEKASNNKNATTGIKANTNTKAQKTKQVFYNYESISVKKSDKQEEPSKVNLTLVSREVKQAPIMKEPQKKASLPTNLKLTLEKIYSKEGSSSHRIQISSPTSESCNKIPGSAVSLKRKNDLTPTLESKTKNIQVEKSPTIQDASSKCKLNTFLVGIKKPASLTNRGKEAQGSNMRELNSMSATPRKELTAVYSIEDRGQDTKKCQQLIAQLKEKNKEIKRLSQDNSELHYTIDAMSSEMKNLNVIKDWVREKGKSIAGLQDVRFPPEEVDQRSSKTLNALNDFDKVQGLSFSQKGTCDWSMREDQMSTPVHSAQLKQRNREDPLTVNTGKKKKRTDNSSDFTQIAEATSLSMSPYSGKHNRNYSATPEKSLKINSTKKDSSTIKKEDVDVQWVSLSAKKIKSAQNGNATTKAISGLVSRQAMKKKESMKIQIDNGISGTIGNLKTTASTSKRRDAYETGSSSEQLKDQISEKLANMGSARRPASGEGNEDNIDIAKALGMLKDRIANLLTKRQKDNIPKA